MDGQEIIKGMIDKILDGDNLGARNDFDSVIASKLSDSLDIKKQEIAQNIYSPSSDLPEEEIQDEDV